MSLNEQDYGAFLEREQPLTVAFRIKCPKWHHQKQLGHWSKNNNFTNHSTLKLFFSLFVRCSTWCCCVIWLKGCPVQFLNEQSQTSLQGHLSPARGALLWGTDIHSTFLCRVSIHSNATFLCELSRVKNVDRKGLMYCNYWRALESLWEYCKLVYVSL